MAPVAYFDWVFLAAVLFGLIGLLKSWRSVLQRGTKLLLAGLLIFMGVYSLCLGLEWSGVTTALDTLEDFIGALIPMWWAFVFYAFVHEITHRDIRESEERYALAQEAANVGSWDWNIETGELVWSDQIESLFGFDRGGFGGTYDAFLDSIDADDRQFVVDSVNASINDDCDYDIEHRIVRPDGTVRWVSETGTVMRDVEGKAVRMLGIVQDITERKRADEELRSVNQQLAASEQQLRASNQQLAASEQELRESQHLLDATINNSPAVIYVKNLAGCYLLVNKTYQEILGMSREEMLGKTDEALFPKDVAEKFRANDERAVESDLPVEFEEVALHANGELHTYLSTKFSLRDSDGLPYAVCGISTDITERKQLEEQERKHHAQVVHFSRLTVAGELASGMAHELNQPLTAITTYAQACRRMIDSGDADPAKIRDATGEIAAQAMRGGEIIRRMRSFVRKQAAQRVKADLNEIVREAIELVKTQARHSEVTLQLEFSEKPLTVLADKVQIQQVVVNLLQNGFESMAKAAACERVLTVRTSRTDEGMMEVAVEDKGAGLPGSDGEKVFESFFTTKSDGLGIGLSISRSIIEEHEGHIWATPNPQKGTTFRVALPSEIGHTLKM